MLFDYGQAAVEQEREAVHALAAAMQCGPVVEMPIADLVHCAEMAGGTPGEVGPRVVPSRNLIMLAIASNYCARIGADVVWYGAIADDFADYYDCRPIFVNVLNLALCDLQIGAPLINASKAEVVEMCRQKGVPLDLCWSCYEPVNGEQCGTCNSCELLP